MIHAYKGAGVDIAAGDRFVARIVDAARATHRPEVLAGIGGFAAHFAFDPTKYRQPVLVSSTDGVGTKLKIAIDCHAYDTIGTDLVAMCVNDLACSGAEPLFFLDYFATGRLDPEAHAPIILGIAAACRAVGCALIGGETAEMPGMYHGEDFDLAGFVVGVVERERMIDGTTIRPGDTLIGVAATGFHSNGYALLRTICRDRGIRWSDPLPGADTTVGEFLLRPTALYSPLVQQLTARCTLKGIAHITGGGLTGNIPRIVPAHCQARIDWRHWKLPPAVAYFAEQGQIDVAELRTVWNCGVGLVLVVESPHANDCIAACTALGHPARVIGTITPRAGIADAIVFD